MSEEDVSADRQKADRRAFLEQCGRFAVVTPPVVSLMLTADSTKKALAASGTVTVGVTVTNGTTTTLQTTTNTTATFSTTSLTTTTTTVSTTTTAATDTINTTTTTTTTTHTGIASLQDPSTPHPNSQLAMMVDSMGVMKVS